MGNIDARRRREAADPAAGMWGERWSGGRALTGTQLEGEPVEVWRLEMKAQLLLQPHRIRPRSAAREAAPLPAAAKEGGREAARSPGSGQAETLLLWPLHALDRMVWVHGRRPRGAELRNRRHGRLPRAAPSDGRLSVTRSRLAQVLVHQLAQFACYQRVRPGVPPVGPPAPAHTPGGAPEWCAPQQAAPGETAPH